MIKLLNDEKDILNGIHGEQQKRMLETIVLFADYYGASELVPITASGHMALGFGKNGYEVVSKILDNLINEGLFTKFGFTVSSWLYAYLDYDRKWMGIFEKKSSVKKREEFLADKLSKLGLDKKNKYLDAISLAKKDFIKKGDVVCWSDSFLSTFAGSALGAKVLNCGPVIDLFCNIFGKAPLYGLLTKEGRKAEVIIKIEIDKLPDAGLLGVAIAQKSKGKIPYIYGLEKLLKAKYDEKTLAFLKDFSAGFSSEGTARLFHINGITPEAKTSKKQLILDNALQIEINEQEIERVKENFEFVWKNLDASPKLCVLGQPDLSLYQLVNWTNEIGWELKQNRRRKLKIRTIFVTNKEVLQQFKRVPEYKELKTYGGIIRTVSPFNSLLAKGKIKNKIITNSNEIRQNYNVKFCREKEILNIITGKRKERSK
jgi:predicted aconitase